MKKKGLLIKIGAIGVIAAAGISLAACGSNAVDEKTAVLEKIEGVWSDKDSGFTCYLFEGETVGIYIVNPDDDFNPQRDYTLMDDYKISDVKKATAEEMGGDSAGYIISAGSIKTFYLSDKNSNEMKTENTFGEENLVRGVHDGNITIEEFKKCVK